VSRGQHNKSPRPLISVFETGVPGLYLRIFEIIFVLTLTVYIDFNPISYDSRDSAVGVRTDYWLD
jgi:hypothetical protein